MVASTLPLNAVPRPEGYEEVQIDSGGVPIVLSLWHAEPARATVVFLAGTMVHPLFYAEFLGGLAAGGFTVVGVHSQGHGKSPRTGAPLTWDALVGNARNAVDYAAERFAGPVVVMGSSQGGMVAMAVAASGVPLAGVVAHNILDPADPSALRVTRFPSWLAVAHRPLRRLVGLAGRLLPWLPVPIGAYLDLSRVCGDPASLERFRTDPLALRAYPLRFLAGLVTADLSGMTDGSIRCPVVVLAATGDPLFPIDDARRLYARIAAPTKRFVEVDLDRHLILNECVPQVLPQVAAEMTTLIEHRREGVVVAPAPGNAHPHGARRRLSEASMELPRYVSLDEARTACDRLHIRDWTQLRDPVVEVDEADKIQREIGAEAAEISTEDLRQGLQVELEHGRMFPDANVTNNHPVLTGLIVLAHLKEMLDYYDRLAVAELEGDILKALEHGDNGKVAQKYTLLVKARARLAAKELARVTQV